MMRVKRKSKRRVGVIPQECSLLLTKEERSLLMFHHEFLQRHYATRKDSRPIRVAVLGAGWFSAT